MSSIARGAGLRRAPTAPRTPSSYACFVAESATTYKAADRTRTGALRAGAAAAQKLVAEALRLRGTGGGAESP